MQSADDVNEDDAGATKTSDNGSTSQANLLASASLSSATGASSDNGVGGVGVSGGSSNGNQLPASLTSRPLPNHLRQRINSVGSIRGTASLDGGETGRDLSSGYGSTSYDDVYDDDATSSSSSEEGRRRSLDEAERRRMEEAAAQVAAASSSAASASSSDRMLAPGQQMIGIRAPRQSHQQEQQHYPSSSSGRGRASSYDTGNEAGRDSSSGEESSDDESSYFSENLPSPRSGSNTPKARTAAAAVAGRGKAHASGVPLAAGPSPQMPMLGLPPSNAVGRSMDNLDTSLSFSDDDDDGRGGSNRAKGGDRGGGGTGVLASSGGHSSVPRLHHNAPPRLHRRSNSDEQLQLYTRTMERSGMSGGQSVSSIVSSSSDEAAGPEPAIHTNSGAFGERSAPPSVTIPNRNDMYNPLTPRDPSEPMYHTDGQRYASHATSRTGTDTGLDDSTVFTSEESSSPATSSSTSSDLSVRDELREIGVPGRDRGGSTDNRRSSGRRKPTKDIGEVTGTTPSSINADAAAFFSDQPSSESPRSQQPPKIMSTTTEADEVKVPGESLPHPHAERANTKQHPMSQAWVAMSPPPAAEVSVTRTAAVAGGSGSLMSSSSSNWGGRSGVGSSNKRISQIRSGSHSIGSGDQSHYFNTGDSATNTSVNMMYSEDDDTAERGASTNAAGTVHNREGETKSRRDGAAEDDRGRSAGLKPVDRRTHFAETKGANAMEGGDDAAEGPSGARAGGFQVYWQRWLMLIYMSILNLLSDWTCYSVAPIAVLTAEAFGAIDPESLVTIFLSANAVASACEPIILGRLGLRRTVVFGSLLLMLGSVVKSGGIPYILSSQLEKGQGEWRVYVGFFLVGLSQPLYQCTPALLSASWFPEKERTMATGVALNSNQLGIGFAFVFGTLLVATSDDIVPYFQLLSLLSTLVFIGCALQFDDAPPTPPSDTARVIRGTLEVDIPSLGQFGNAVSQSSRYISKSVRNLILGAQGGGAPSSSGLRRSRGSGHSLSGSGLSPNQRRKGAPGPGSATDAFRTSQDQWPESATRRKVSRRGSGSGSSGISYGSAGNRARSNSEHSLGSLSSSGALAAAGGNSSRRRSSSGNGGGRSDRRSATGNGSGMRSSSGSRTRSSGKSSGGDSTRRRSTSRGEGERSSKSSTNRGGGSSSKQRRRTGHPGPRQSATAEYGFRMDPLASGSRAPAPSPAISDSYPSRSAIQDIAALEREAFEVGFSGPMPSPMMPGTVGDAASGPDSGGGGGDTNQHSRPGPPSSGTPPRPTRRNRSQESNSTPTDAGRSSSRDAGENEFGTGDQENYPTNTFGQPDSPFPNLQYDDGAGMTSQQEYPPYGLETTGGMFQTPDGQLYYAMFPQQGYYPHQTMMPMQPPPHYNPYAYSQYAATASPYQQIPPDGHHYTYGGAAGQQQSYASLPDFENPLDEGAEPILVQTAHKLDINIRDDQILLSLRACFSRPGFVHCLASFTVSGIVINTLSTFMDYLVRLGGAGREYVGIIGGLFQLLIMISSLIIGGFTDKTRAYYSVSMAMLVLGAFALAECGVNLDEDRGNGLRWSLLVVGTLVGPLQPISTELGVDVVYPLSENTVLVIQQLFSNLLSALFIPFFKALKDVNLSDSNGESMMEKPQYTFSFYLLIILHASVTFYFATFNGRYLRLEAELEKKRKKEEEEALETYMQGMNDQERSQFREGLAAVGHNNVGSFEPVSFDHHHHHQQHQQQQPYPYQQPYYQQQYHTYPYSPQQAYNYQQYDSHYAGGVPTLPPPPPHSSAAAAHGAYGVYGYGEQQPLMSGTQQHQSPPKPSQQRHDDGD